MKPIQGTASISGITGSFHVKVDFIKSPPGMKPSVVDEFPGRDVAWVSSSPHIVAEMTVPFRRKKDALKTKLLTPFYDGQNTWLVTGIGAVTGSRGRGRWRATFEVKRYLKPPGRKKSRNTKQAKA